MSTTDALALFSTPPALTDPRSHSLATQVYLNLRGAILHARLLPGVSLSEKTLAEHLGVGRTPVREAIQRLAGDGLVNVYPQRGSSVALIDLQSIREALFVRQAVECAIVAHLITRPDLPALLLRLSALIDAQAAANREGRTGDTLRCDADFHRLMVEHSAVPGVWTVIERARDLHQRVRAIALPELGSGSVAVSDHRAIVAALESRDEAAAINAMRQHIERNYALALDVAQSHPDYFVPRHQAAGAYQGLLQ